MSVPRSYSADAQNGTLKKELSNHNLLWNKRFSTLFSSFFVCKPTNNIHKLRVIHIGVKASTWSFNQLDNCVLPRKALYWPYFVPRIILKAFYAPFQTNSPFSRRSRSKRRKRSKQVSPPASPSVALANFLYQLSLRLMQNFSPISYPSRGIGWLLCGCFFFCFVCFFFVVVVVLFFFLRKPCSIQYKWPHEGNCG